MNVNTINTLCLYGLIIPGVDIYDDTEKQVNKQ